MTRTQDKKITSEQEFLISTLADYIAGRARARVFSNSAQSATTTPTALGTKAAQSGAVTHLGSEEETIIVVASANSTLVGADASAIAELSNAQQLSAIIYYQTHIPQLQPAFASSSYFAVNREKFIARMGEEFAAAGIKYLIFKGLEVAKYYPHPSLRISGDIDLLVKQEDKARAGEILESLGFQGPEHKSADHEWCYSKGDFEIELHHRLLYEGDDLNESGAVEFTDGVWEHATSEDGTFYTLEPEFHFTYLLLHLRKHFLWAGTGIRPFVDLAVMMHYAGLDLGKVQEYIEACGIEKFASICLGLVGRWFKVEVGQVNDLVTSTVEIEHGKSVITDEFYVRATNLVLGDGVFGDMSRETLVDNAVANTASKHGKLASAFGIIFPPYAQIKLKYPGACKNDAIGHLLLPALWVCRIIESIVARRAGESFSYAAKHLTTNKDREALLQQWGIK